MRLVQNEQRPAATGRSGDACLDDYRDNDAARTAAAQVPGPLTRREAAQYLKCSLAKFDRLKSLPRHLLGASPRYFADELDAWMRSQRGAP